MARLPKSLEDLIMHFGRLPGIGPKTAARLAFYVLTSEQKDVDDFSKTLTDVKANIRECEQCFNISENAVCEICQDSSRDTSLICVVEEPLDIIAIEKTGNFRGLYHVLGGTLSPLHGISPDDLTIASLLARARSGKIQEMVIATNANVEGEATAMYIAKEMTGSPVKVTRPASGLPFGSDLEYTDEFTLTQAMNNRREYK
jgi:recombination protein RecR